MADIAKPTAPRAPAHTTRVLRTLGRIAGLLTISWAVWGTASGLLFLGFAGLVPFSNGFGGLLVPLFVWAAVTLALGYGVASGARLAGLPVMGGSAWSFPFRHWLSLPTHGLGACASGVVAVLVVITVLEAVDFSPGSDREWIAIFLCVMAAVPGWLWATLATVAVRCGLTGRGLGLFAAWGILIRRPVPLLLAAFGGAALGYGLIHGTVLLLEVTAVATTPMVGESGAIQFAIMLGVLIGLACAVPFALTLWVARDAALRAQLRREGGVASVFG